MKFVLWLHSKTGAERPSMHRRGSLSEPDWSLRSDLFASPVQRWIQWEQKEKNGKFRVKIRLYFTVFMPTNIVCPFPFLSVHGLLCLPVCLLWNAPRKGRVFWLDANAFLLFISNVNCDGHNSTYIGHFPGSDVATTNQSSSAITLCLPLFRKPWTVRSNLESENGGKTYILWKRFIEKFRRMISWKL